MRSQPPKHMHLRIQHILKQRYFFYVEICFIFKKYFILLTCSGQHLERIKQHRGHQGDFNLKRTFLVFNGSSASSLAVLNADGTSTVMMHSLPGLIEWTSTYCPVSHSLFLLYIHATSYSQTLVRSLIGLYCVSH